MLKDEDKGKDKTHFNINHISININEGAVEVQSSTASLEDVKKHIIDLTVGFSNLFLERKKEKDKLKLLGGYLG